MSFVGDIVGDALSNLFVFGRTDRKLRRLLDHGEQLRGTIDGYRIRDDSDAGERHWVSVTIDDATAGPWRATVRQRLTPQGTRAPLGTRVIVLHHRGTIAVDWPATLRENGIPTPGNPAVIAGNTLKEPLPPGIDDSRIDAKRLARGTAAEAVVTAAHDTIVMGMPTQNKDLHLEVDGRSVVLKRELIPHYAEALSAVGTRLPVAIDRKKPDRITIDWATAALQAAR